MYATQNNIPSCLKGYTIKTTAKSKFSSPNYTFHASVTLHVLTWTNSRRQKNIKKRKMYCDIFFLNFQNLSKVFRQIQY